MITITNKMKTTVTRRSTRQRRVILDELCKVKTHPSADVLVRMDRRRLPKISSGAVYRNLNLLSSENKVLELSFGKNSCRYDGMVKEHMHFFCLKCNNIFDVEGVSLEELDNKVARELNCKIEYQMVKFYGYCHKCRSKY